MLASTEASRAQLPSRPACFGRNSNAIPNFSLHGPGRTRRVACKLSKRIDKACSLVARCASSAVVFIPEITGFLEKRVASSIAEGKPGRKTNCPVRPCWALNRTKCFPGGWPARRRRSSNIRHGVSGGPFRCQASRGPAEPRCYHGPERGVFLLFQKS